MDQKYKPNTAQPGTEAVGYLFFLDTLDIVSSHKIYFHMFIYSYI